MSAHPFLIELVWDVLNQFLSDWQAEPYRWSRERDVQVQLANRLDAALNLVGRGSILANYGNAISGFERKQVWNRVCCEPKVQYQWEADKAWCFPDVVVLDDIDDPQSPPDAFEEGVFPILWVCEIKLDPHPQTEDKKSWNDLTKITALVEQGRASYACWLTLFRRRAQTGDGIQWDKKEERLWQCTAMLPAMPATS